MSDSEALLWWRDSASEFGVKIMDKLVSRDSQWDDVVETGRRDVRAALQKTSMKTGRDLAVLELGCGMGRLSCALAEHFGEVVGVDVSDKLIAEARLHNRLENVRFECSDGHQIGLGDPRKFDTVFSFEVFHYLDARLLRENFTSVYEFLKPGGEFVFEVNCSPISSRTRASMLFRSCLYQIGIREWRGWPNAPGFRRFPHSVAQIKDLLEKTGFEIRKVIDGNLKQTWFVASRPS